MLTFGFYVRIYIPHIFIFAVERLELIHDIIRKNPAVRFNDVMRLSKLKNGTLTHYISKLEDNPQRLACINERLSQIQHFVRKFHLTNSNELKILFEESIKS